MLPPYREHLMPKNTPPPICPKCGEPMRFTLIKTGGRKFRCPDCDSGDPMNMPHISRLLAGELGNARASSSHPRFSCAKPNQTATYLLPNHHSPACGDHL
jgi:ssDNA-binding Zn-finger/Zn-ribbon topoisomerase 1